MKIAIIGWGSLIWDPRELPREGVWQEDGPIIKIEFSRVSRDCRLTLVVDENNGLKTKTRFAFSPRSDIEDAINDLKIREGTVKKWIGYVDIKHDQNSLNYHPNQVNIHEDLKNWCRDKSIDAAVWTALLSNFFEETKLKFSVHNALKYIESLSKSANKNALKYIQNASSDILTPLRSKLIALKLIE
ncbi:MAG: hypothetical protein KAU46_12045 [Candidatus Aminicenantes bacterium]|nr:hypothetical protein [Candidatus Aminicenantes bacterium]